MKKLIEKLKALFAKLFGKEEAPAPVPSPVPPPGYVPPEAPPRVVPPAGVVVRGVVVRGSARFAPTAPIADDWLPPFESTVMYGTYIPNGPVCEEARIAIPPGARSPKGYPMVNGKVSFNGHLWANDGEVVTYVAQVAARDAALQKWQEDFARVRYIGTSGVDASTVHENLDETLYLRGESRSFYGDLYRVVLSGSNADISRCINNGEYGSGTRHDGVRSELQLAVQEAFAAQSRGEKPIYRTA